MKMRRLLSIVCLLALVVGLAPAVLAAEEPKLTAYGWFETICAELTGVTDDDVTAVTYTGAMDGELKGEDFDFLVRDMEGGVRIDIPGVKAGTYSLTVTAKGQDYTAQGVQVVPYDRSGFAHQVVDADSGCTPYEEGVGAYNNDGTLKTNAKVIYVTNDNKNTVVATAHNGGTAFTVTGIANILNSGSSNNNNNQRNFFKRHALNDGPLVIRFIGGVERPDETGLTSPKPSSPGKDDGDNGYMADMVDATNVTIEGIGPDAAIDGWGISFNVGNGDGEFGLGKNIEVRNLTFRNVPEDCIGLNGRSINEANQGGKNEDPLQHIWVHNNAFYVPYIEDAMADDKFQGDGAVDFKYGRYMTLSYNYFEGYHKTSLIGGGDSQKQYHVTWHHNWWKDVESRSPLARQADVHIYNNLYDGQSDYCMSLRASTYIFSEFNTFINARNPFIDEKTKGVAKSYQDDLSGAYYGGKQAGKTVADNATVVTDKAQAIAQPSGNTNPYFNFDTAPGSYVAEGDYQLDSCEVAVAKVKAWAGTMKAPEPKTLESDDGETLEYIYSAGGLTLTAPVPEGDMVLVACWDGDSFAGAKVLDENCLGAEIGTGWSKVKLFWVDDQYAPKCVNGEF